MADVTVRDLAEHLARRLRVHTGRIELIFNAGHCCEGYVHDRLKPTQLEAIDALADELLERAAAAADA